MDESKLRSQSLEVKARAFRAFEQLVHLCRDIMVDRPDTMVDLSDTLLDLPNTMVDLPDTRVVLPDTMVDLSDTW